MPETTKESIAGFCNRTKISLTCKQVSENPNMENDAWSQKAYHWICSFKLPNQEHGLDTFFSQGSVHKKYVNGEWVPTRPKLETVLCCLLSNALGLNSNIHGSDCECSHCFESWTDEYGYDQDSRKAERTFKIVVGQTRKLRVFLGEYWESFLQLDPD